MNFYNLSLFYLFIQTLLVSNSHSDETSSLNDRVQIHNELNLELKNAICCVKKMRCCKKKPKSANLEMRAVLVRCPNTACEGSVLTRHLKKPVYSTRERDIKQFQGFDEDEPLALSTITNCRKKLLLTIKISGSGFDTRKNEYIVVDHVYDPETRKNTRILTPYVIKLKQEPIMQMYGLKFLHVVNSQAKEIVYNKHDANYTGCDTTSSKPTCGKITYNGKMIPYSQGFCCSCDALKNTKRQPESLNEYAESVISYSDPAYLLDGVECPRNLKGKDNINQADDLITNTTWKNKQQHTQQTGYTKPITTKPIKHKKFSQEPKHHQKTAQNKKLHYPTQEPLYEFNQAKIPQESLRTSGKLRNHTGSLNGGFINEQAEKYYKALNDFIKDKDSKELNDEITNLEKLLGAKRRLSKRQVQSSGGQRRGGQNCADRYTPAGLDSGAYHESTHCLRFSDLWYTVYHLQPPMVEHSVLFQIFEKHEDMNGHTRWRDITKGKMVRVGTINRQYLDEKNTISIKYSPSPEKINPSGFSLNYKAALLFVPERIKKPDIKKHPEIAGGPAEYLVAHVSQISLDGDQCNVAGVGFEAFVKQPNRCSRPRGTCLSNQPYNLWRHDHEAGKLGKRGCFFLKHYGSLPRNPIRKNPKNGEQFLVMEYAGVYSNTIDLEIKADFNTVLRPQSSAKITEVYVDSTSPSKTFLTIKITNSGLTSSSFMTRLTDCPLEMPATFSNIQSKPVLIPPQHQHIFHLEIKCSLPADRFHCSVEALNCKGELVALRRIRLQKFDRCICTWHCLCACVGSSEGLKCMPMSLQHYHAAGFQGSLPVTSYVIHYTFFDDILSMLLYIFLFLILILFTLGLCKALIGICCCPIVGIWGLDIILDLPKPMKKYYESNLRERKVLYDKEGWPVHPDTKQKVRNVSRSTEFCMNIIFFFTYPFNVTILLLKRICCPVYIYENEQRSQCWYEEEEKHKYSGDEKMGKCYCGEEPIPKFVGNKQKTSSSSLKKRKTSSSSEGEVIGILSTDSDYDLKLVENSDEQETVETENEPEETEDSSSVEESETDFTVVEETN